MVLWWCGSADKVVHGRGGFTAGRFTISYVAIFEIECSRYFLMLIIV
jgi:hypothetical protein